MKKRQRSWNPPPGSRSGLTMPKSVWGRKIHQHWRRVNCRACLSRYFLEPLSFLILFSISTLSTPCPWSPSGYLISSFFLFGFRAVATMSGQLPVTGGRVPEAKSLQKIEFLVARSKAKNLYDVLEVAGTWPEPSRSSGPPLPKRHRHAPTAMVLSPRAQELEATASDLSAQKHGATAPRPNSPRV